MGEAGRVVVARRVIDGVGAGPVCLALSWLQLCDVWPVGTHASNVLRKTQQFNRSALARWAYRPKIV